MKILDISADEEPDYVADLNHIDFTKDFQNQFDFILDLGTQEHVFNNSNFLENVFNLLKPSGKYIFSLPANGYLEHGFRQYSPTFFFDLCNANLSYLRLDSLSLHTSRSNFDVLPLYQKLDPKFANICRTEYKKIFVDLGPLTGTAISIINQSSGYVDLLGVITKLKTNKLSLDGSQCLYRNYKLNEILPGESDSNFYANIQFKPFIKKLFMRLPLQADLKLISLEYALRLLSKLKSMYGFKQI